MDQHAFTPKQMPDVLTQWRSPNHPEFAESRTVWRLFNAVTEAIKGSLWALPARTQALHGLLDAHVGLVRPQLTLSPTLPPHNPKQKAPTCFDHAEAHLQHYLSKKIAIHDYRSDRSRASRQSRRFPRRNRLPPPR